MSTAARFLDLLQDPRRVGAPAYALTLGGFRRARQELRPARRPRPHRDRAESDPRRARRPHACSSTAATPGRTATRRMRDQGPGHGRLHGAAEARRHGRPLGVHARRRARQGDHRRSSAFRSSAQNIRDTEWNEPAFEPMAMIERGGVKIAVIGQAFPYTPIANPRWMMPNWSFGIREEDLQGNVDKARQGRRRAGGAAVAQRLRRRPQARRARARHRRDPHRRTPTTRCPSAVKVGKTLLVASGSHGKFLSRLDLDVARRRGEGLPLSSSSRSSRT